MMKEETDVKIEPKPRYLVIPASGAMFCTTDLLDDFERGYLKGATVYKLGPEVKVKIVIDQVPSIR